MGVISQQQLDQIHNEVTIQANQQVHFQALRNVVVLNEFFLGDAFEAHVKTLQTKHGAALAAKHSQRGALTDPGTSPSLADIAKIEIHKFYQAFVTLPEAFFTPQLSVIFTHIAPAQLHKWVGSDDIQRFLKKLAEEHAVITVENLNTLIQALHRFVESGYQREQLTAVIQEQSLSEFIEGLDNDQLRNLFHLIHDDEKFDQLFWIHISLYLRDAAPEQLDAAEVEHKATPVPQTQRDWFLALPRHKALMLIAQNESQLLSEAVLVTLPIPEVSQHLRAYRDLCVETDALLSEYKNCLRDLLMETKKLLDEHAEVKDEKMVLNQNNHGGVLSALVQKDIDFMVALQAILKYKADSPQVSPFTFGSTVYDFLVAAKDKQHPLHYNVSTFKGNRSELEIIIDKTKTTYETWLKKINNHLEALEGTAFGAVLILSNPILLHYAELSKPVDKKYTPATHNPKGLAGIFNAFPDICYHLMNWFIPERYESLDLSPPQLGPQLTALETTEQHSSWVAQDMELMSEFIAWQVHATAGITVNKPLFLAPTTKTHTAKTLKWSATDKTALDDLVTALEALPDKGLLAQFIATPLHGWLGLAITKTIHDGVSNYHLTLLDPSPNFTGPDQLRKNALAAIPGQINALLAEKTEGRVSITLLNDVQCILPSDSNMVLAQNMYDLVTQFAAHPDRAITEDVFTLSAKHAREQGTSVNLHYQLKEHRKVAEAFLMSSGANEYVQDYDYAANTLLSAAIESNKAFKLALGSHWGVRLPFQPKPQIPVVTHPQWHAIFVELNTRELTLDVALEVIAGHLDGALKTQFENVIKSIEAIPSVEQQVNLKDNLLNNVKHVAKEAAFKAARQAIQHVPAAKAKWDQIKQADEVNNTPDVFNAHFEAIKQSRFKLKTREGEQRVSVADLLSHGAVNEQFKADFMFRKHEQGRIKVSDATIGTMFGQAAPAPTASSAPTDPAASTHEAPATMTPSTT